MVLWAAGNKASRLEFLPSPDNPLDLQLRSTRAISDYADRVPHDSSFSGTPLDREDSRFSHKSNSGLPGNASPPLFVRLSEENQYLEALAWTLDTIVWDHTKNDVFILNLDRAIDLDEILSVLRSGRHKLQPEDVLTGPRAESEGLLTLGLNGGISYLVVT